MWLTLPRSQPIGEGTRDRTLSRGHREMTLIGSSSKVHSACILYHLTLAQGGMAHNGLGPPTSIMNHENTPDLPTGLI